MDIDEMIERLEDELASFGNSLQTLNLMIATRGAQGEYGEEFFSLQRTLEELHEMAFDMWEKGQESTEE